jgi:hypothetical protein
MTRIVDVCHLNVRVSQRRVLAAFDEKTAVDWLTRAVEVVEGVAELPRLPTFREAKKSWGRQIGMETTSLPREGARLETVLVDVVTPSGTLNFVVGSFERQAYVSLSVINALSGGERHREIRQWMADYFCEMLSFFSSAPFSSSSMYLTTLPEVTALVECQEWRYDSERQSDLNFPAWALALSRDQRALLPSNVIELTPAAAVVPVVRAPFPATSRDRSDWESWFRVLEPVVGPIDFDTLNAGNNLVPQ